MNLTISQDIIKRSKNKSKQAAVIVIARETSIGNLTVVKSRKGLCYIALGDVTAQLFQELEVHFTDIKHDVDDFALHQDIECIVEMIETPKLVKNHNFRLDINGTVFQKKVWAALCEVQCGEIISYEELAQNIGMPKAYRAVANACACNKLALVIPCHRVVRKNGALSGYRWGIQRKQILLQRERY